MHPEASRVLVTMAACCSFALLWQCGSGPAETAQRVAQGGSGSTDGASGTGTGTAGTGIVFPTDSGAPCTDCDSSVEPRCGDGTLNVDLQEECDDGNVASGDGCSECKLQTGWACPFPGLACEAAKCGDSIIAGSEQCDFGATMPEGCDADTCRVQPGYACDQQDCHPTVCGDGTPETGEACDDGNSNWGDGCTPDCQREPDCSGSSCTSTCGDGLLLVGVAGEACDDGNADSGDGCSATCAVEEGFSCEVTSAAETGTLVLPIVYRDMKKRQDSGGHPNFEVDPGAGGNVDGIAGPLGSLWDEQGKPKYAATPTATSTNASNGWTTNATDFGTWFRDSDYSSTVIDRLTLVELPTSPGTFRFEDTSFFPLDDRGWDDPPLSGSHNYYFTSELRYWFQWAGGEELTFFGDDDVWVYINKRLAVDIGGIHGPRTESVTLDDDTNTSLGLGLTAGEVYEIAVFQAERHVTGSQYQLTLKGFNVGRSQCSSKCGDGIVTPDELCDEGTLANVGGYGHCSPDCKTRGGYCGDGIVQAEGGEFCDDGNRRFGDGCDSACRKERIR